MGLDSLITVILVLVVLGFICWLLFTKVPMASPFKEIIMFVIVLAVILWLLSFLGLWSGPVGVRG
jgi:hypothetical protein